MCSILTNSAEYW